MKIGHIKSGFFNIKSKDPQVKPGKIIERTEMNWYKSERRSKKCYTLRQYYDKI